MDRGSVALQVNEGKPKLVRIPHPGPDASVTARDVDVRLRSDGSAEVAIDAHVTGVNAPDWRRRYHTEGTRRERAERDLSAELGPVELAPGPAGVSVGDLEDIEKPVEVRLKGTASTLARREGDQLSMQVAPTQQLVQTYGALSTREHEVVLGALSTQTDTWTVTVPPGMKVVSAPASSNKTTPFGGYEFEVETQPGKVTVRSKVWISKPRIAPAEYAKFRAFCEAVDRTFDQPVVFGK